MENKQCTGKNSCGQVLPLSEFYTSKSNKSGFENKCKVCRNKSTEQYRIDNKEKIRQRSDKWRMDNLEKHTQNIKRNYLSKREEKIKQTKEYQTTKKDGFHHVYLLPEVNYIGITDNIYIRMNNHKHDNNISSADKYEILHSFESRDHAEIVEDYYHELGWKGKKGAQNKNLLKS